MKRCILRSPWRTGAHTCAGRPVPALRKASPLLRENGDPRRATPASTWRSRATLKEGGTACDNPTPRQCREGHAKPLWARHTANDLGTSEHHMRKCEPLRRGDGKVHLHRHQDRPTSPSSVGMDRKHDPLPCGPRATAKRLSKSSVVLHSALD